MKSDVLLICNGDLPDQARLESLAAGAACIVAADGGANKARDRGVKPHVVIGDLDSVTPSTMRWLVGSEIIRVEDQNLCDFEKALDLISVRAHRNVAVVGIEGQRFDFTLSNFSVIWRYVSHMDLALYGRTWRAYPITSSHMFYEPPGTTVSLIPFGPCAGITLKGLEYGLTNAELSVGRTAVSNRVQSSPFSVGIGTGHLLMVIQEA